MCVDTVNKQLGIMLLGKSSSLVLLVSLEKNQ